MKQLTKTLALVLVLCFVLSLGAFASGEPSGGASGGSFAQVDDTHWAGGSITIESVEIAAEYADYVDGTLFGNVSKVVYDGGEIDVDYAKYAAILTVGGVQVDLYNAAGETFEGDVVVYGNLSTKSGQQVQANVVLDQANNTTINTTNTGLGADAHIGVYVTGDTSNNPYKEHGQFEQDFGTHGTSTANMDAFTNDRNGLYGEACPVSGHGTLIRWVSYLCKLTDSDGKLLYTDATHTKPAVCKTLTEAFTAVSSGALYQGTSDSAYSGSSAIKVEMLRNYTMPITDTTATSGGGITNSASRSVTLTTAGKTASGTDVYIYNKGSETGMDENYATIKRGYTGSSLFTQSGTELTLTGIILDGNKTSYNANTNGGLINVTAGTLNVQTGATLRNSQATNGGAVYVASGGTMTMNAGTVTGNTATTAGAGIYLVEGATLKLEGSPSFSDNKMIDGGGANISITNGGQTVIECQDIYLAGTGSPLGSLVLTGNLNAPNGSIWVWADGGTADANHYKMLKQFAVLDSSFTDTVTDTTYKAFRNARPDDDTDCGGDYLTGQEGEDINGKKCIYWTGGFDVVFLKTDGFDAGLSGATFMLYSDEDCETEYQMTFSDGTKSASTESSDGSASYQDRTGTTATLSQGEVLLSKVAPKTYYMKETTAPTGYRLDTTIYQVMVSGTGELTLMKKSSPEAGTYDEEVYSVTSNDTGKYPGGKQYHVMNTSATKRKVILRKVAASTYSSLPDSNFRIFRADLTEYAEGQPTGQNYYESGTSGVYFIDQLPEGKYYLVETAAPTGYGGNTGKVFTLEVTAAGVTDPTVSAGVIDVGNDADIPANLKDWVAAQTALSNDDSDD